MTGLRIEDFCNMSSHARVVEEVITKSEHELETYFNTITNLHESESEALPSPIKHLRPKSPQQREVDYFKYMEARLFEESQESTRTRTTEYCVVVNINLSELLCQHRVLMIRVAHDGKVDDSYFLECVQFVQSKTSNIHIVMNNVDASRESIKKLRPITSLMWNFLPNTIFGFLRSPLYLLRTFIIAMASLPQFRCFKPTLIFVDAHPIAIPFLKNYFSCSVVSFAYFQSVPLRKKIGKISPIPKTHNSTYNYYLKYADQVLVPSLAVGKNYFHETNRAENFPIVYYPPVNGSTVDGERFTPRPSILLGANNTEPISILFIGQWHSFVKFDLALLIFQDFFLDLNEMQQKRMKFIFIGYMELSDKEAIECRRKITKKMLDFERKYRKHLWYCTNPAPELLCELYRNCIGVLHMSDDDDFAWPLLECQYFGRPAISLKNSFSREILKHGVNGFLMDLDPYEASEYLCYIFSWVGDTLAKHCNSDYTAKFSQVRRSKIIENIMMKFLSLSDVNIV